MQDFTIATPVTFRRPYLPRVMLPNLGIGATVAAMIETMGAAVNMAYVAPYGTIRSEKSASDVVDLNGRDPNW